MNSPFVPTGMWESTREKEYAAFEAGVNYGGKHWMSNHKRLVQIHRAWKERDKKIGEQMSINIKDAREALDSLDDYARMNIGVDAIGPRGVLENFINEVEQLCKELSGKPLPALLKPKEG